MTKLVTPEERRSSLFRLVSLLTGLKNSLKGAGYFLGAATVGVRCARRRRGPRWKTPGCLATCTGRWRAQSGRAPHGPGPRAGRAAEPGARSLPSRLHPLLLPAPCSYHLSLGILCGLILAAMPWAATGLSNQLGRARKENVRFAALFK